MTKEQKKLRLMTGLLVVIAAMGFLLLMTMQAP